MSLASIDRRTFASGAFSAGALVCAGAVACGCGAAHAHATEAVPAGADTAATLAALTADSKDATPATVATNDAVYALLDFSDEQERDFASRNLIAAPDVLEIVTDDGKVAWSQAAYAFLDGADAPADAPATANPSLWRNTQLNHLYGLFEVVDGIYQVRGYDMTNITFVRGETGWIVFDPLMCIECAQAAFELLKANVEDLPVVGIVMSHPHVDHYGGIRGIVTSEEIAERNIPLIVPDGFETHAVAENVYAGNAMARRAGYQYGTMLTPGEKGSLAIGIGMGQSKGTISYISPNDIITQTGETRTVDGVTMEFQLTPGTEAPSEMNTWFPQKHALWVAENCTGTLHNLYTLRGAEVRDGNAWANYIMEAKARYGADVEVTFQSHNWPHWGNDVVNAYLQNTAAVYKFITTQTLMYLNQGLTSTEISNVIALPDDLARVWYTRQYYGTVAHDARAVYQKYMGFYDANPVNLNPLAPSDYARKLVDYLGDTGAVLSRAAADFAAGEYQWVAQITNTLVFADPDNTAARLLCADALEQMAYQAESGTWRNVYLSGAKELREGTVADENYKSQGSADLRRAMPANMMLDYLGILTDANAAQDLNLTVNLVFSDTDPYLLTVKSGVVLYQKGMQAPQADAAITMPRAAMFAVLTKNADAFAQAATVEGDQDIFAKLTEFVVDFDFFFNIIEP